MQWRGRKLDLKINLFYRFLKNSWKWKALINFELEFYFQNKNKPNFKILWFFFKKMLFVCQSCVTIRSNMQVGHFLWSTSWSVDWEPFFFMHACTNNGVLGFLTKILKTTQAYSWFWTLFKKGLMISRFSFNKMTTAWQAALVLLN